MTNPQVLRDLWLIVTVIATLSISGISLFLWVTFRNSSRKWFFWTLALALASIALEHVSAEIKNLHDVGSWMSFAVAGQWLAGRIQEAVIATAVLAYMVFGRNGKSNSKQDANQ